MFIMKSRSFPVIKLRNQKYAHGIKKWLNTPINNAINCSSYLRFFEKKLIGNSNINKC